jgi:hypothetical protein
MNAARQNGMFPAKRENRAPKKHKNITSEPVKLLKTKEGA